MNHDLSKVPASLVDRAQWVAWQEQLRKGKLTKVPINARTGSLASTTDASTWGTFADAVEAFTSRLLDGVGFVFANDDPFTGIDLDDCRDPDKGEIAAWAREIIADLRSYTEVSPSGTGVKIWVEAKLPHGARNRTKYHSGEVEIYSRGRYFTVTGRHLEGTPQTIEPRQAELSELHGRLFSAQPTPKLNGAAQHGSSRLSVSDAELIDRARLAKNGAKFSRLWAGDTDEYDGDDSRADLALCCELAFWTGRDYARMDSIFRMSGLMREKWNRADYRERTLKEGIKGTTNVYDPIANRAERAIRSEEDRGDGGRPSPNLFDYPFTDTGNAERLVALFGPNFRFCSEMKKWFVWYGCRWNCQDTRRVKMLAKRTMRLMYAQAADIPDPKMREAGEKHARYSESAKGINAMLACAEYEDGVTVSASQFDQNIFLLNFLDCTLDLRTFEKRQHRREDLITKLVHLIYNPGAACPQFLKFLDRIMAGGERALCMVGYLQKCFGYALTGDVSEKAVFCFFVVKGDGNNGKTTLLEIIRFVIAEYSAQVLIDNLMAHQSRESNASLSDMADLMGNRFVTTSEGEEGQRLAVAKLKYLSQGMGSIKTCRKYENPITFMATHKIFIDSNHRPVVRGSEKAVWNRLKPVPFTVTIQHHEMDKGLLGKLKTEAEGILAWMVEGCRRWQLESLGDPPEVAAASEAWQAESDRFPVFLSEICFVDPDAWVPTSQLWPEYQNWCEVNAEKFTLSKTAFDERIQKIGCYKGKRETVLSGLGLEYGFEPKMTTGKRPGRTTGQVKMPNEEN